LGRKNGDALWPDRYPKATLKVIEETSHFWWNGLYQQRPAALEGNLVKQSWFRYYTTATIDGRVWVTLHKTDGDVRVLFTDLRIYFTVDLAVSTKTSADYTVVSVWGLVPATGDLLWLDAVAEQMEGPDQPDLIKKMWRTHNPTLIGIESTAYQLSLVQALMRDGLPVLKLHADKDKVSRFIPAGNDYKNGLIFHPRHASWVSNAETQLLNFPNASHDDYVDTCSYAAKMRQVMLGVGEVKMIGH
jgi:predicted phage terminase large subunit-like protein